MVSLAPVTAVLLNWPTTNIVLLAFIFTMLKPVHGEFAPILGVLV